MSTYMKSKGKKLIYASSYDRGLIHLLYMWPAIKNEYPESTLDIAYGWDLFDVSARGNPERMAFKAEVEMLMDQPGITHHGRVGKGMLGKLRNEADIWVYPTNFDEINCITALEMQADKVYPVVINRAALKETVISGIKIDGNINDKSTQESFLKALLEVMGKSSVQLQKEMKDIPDKVRERFNWSRIAWMWDDQFTSQQPEPLVTIYTPTVREGWWEMMSQNIAAQTYQNIEWVIVDDHEKDRSSIAQEYAQKYDLDIRYFRGKKRDIERAYSLVSANNTMVQNARGETVIFLQDFILMPERGVEWVVDFYNRHPNDLLAMTDIYHEPGIKPVTANTRDWFGLEDRGRTFKDVVGKFMRKNIRINNQGFRQSDNAVDWEANYGAIPMSVLKELNGFWEFFDEGLGFDNAEIAYRAMSLGSKLYIDEINQAICIDHWGVLGVDEGGKGINRRRRLNDPRFQFMVEGMKKGIIPIIRDEALDNRLSLQYEIPESVSDLKCADWIRENYKDIAQKWIQEIEQ